MRGLIVSFCLAVFLFSCDNSASEFQAGNFIKFFGSGFESRGYDVIELSDEGYVLTGYDLIDNTDYQIMVVRTDRYGNQLWNHTYGMAGMREEGRVIREVSDGFIIAGVSSASGEVTHSFILKLNMNGDSLWYNEFGNPDYSIEVKDIFASADTILVAGSYYLGELTSGTSGFYAAKLSHEGDVYWDVDNFPNSGSYFERVFFQNNAIFLIGFHGTEKKIYIANPTLQDGLPPEFSKLLPGDGEVVADGLILENTSYILANSGAAGTKLLKLNSNFDEEWQTPLVTSVAGKSFALLNSGSLIICGESTEAGNRLINTIEVSPDGTTRFGEDHFRTIPGSVEKVRQTADEGLILIGSTNATFGENTQLIKTDRDLFLLKP